MLATPCRAIALHNFSAPVAAAAYRHTRRFHCRFLPPPSHTPLLLPLLFDADISSIVIINMPQLTYRHDVSHRHRQRGPSAWVDYHWVITVVNVIINTVNLTTMWGKHDNINTFTNNNRSTNSTNVGMNNQHSNTINTKFQ